MIWHLLSTTENEAEKLWNTLPWRLRNSWFHYAAYQFPCFAKCINFVRIPTFSDASQAVEDINSFQLFWKASDMMNKLDQHFFPSVKCPVGCWSFPERCTAISFKHYLKFLIPSFCGFSSDYRRHFTAKRADYELPDSYFGILVQPSLITQDNNLCILFCRDHAYKSNIQYVHVPKSRFKNLFSPAPDRFAPAILTSRNIMPFSENTCTSSYKMVPMTASYQGVSTCFLTQDRKLDWVSELMLLHEDNYLINRPDCQVVLHRLAEYGDGDYAFVDNVIARAKDQAFSDNPRITEAEGASFVPLESVCFMNVLNNMLQLPVAADNNLTTSLTWPTIVAKESRLMHFTCCQAISYDSYLKPLFVTTHSLPCSFLLFLCCNNVLFMYNLLFNQLAPTPVLLQLLLCLRKNIIHSIV